MVRTKTRLFGKVGFLAAISFIALTSLVVAIAGEMGFDRARAMLEL
jgi:hypothetical protein